MSCAEVTYIRTLMMMSPSPASVSCGRVYRQLADTCAMLSNTENWTQICIVWGHLVNLPYNRVQICYDICSTLHWLLIRS